MPTAKQDKTRKNGLTVKDLIVMGVFGALLMVCSMIGGVLFAVTPTLTFYFSIGAALLPGPVFLLLLAKVPKRWGLTIIGVIISLLSLIMGMHWGMCVGGSHWSKRIYDIGQNIQLFTSIVFGACNHIGKKCTN